jgi:hypothetical protein
MTPLALLVPVVRDRILLPLVATPFSGGSLPSSQLPESMRSRQRKQRKRTHLNRPVPRKIHTALGHCPLLDRVRLCAGGRNESDKEGGEEGEAGQHRDLVDGERVWVGGSVCTAEDEEEEEREREARIDNPPARTPSFSSSDEVGSPSCG